jgi:hypothetical protein
MVRGHLRGVRTETVIVLCLTALLTLAPLMPPAAAALPALGIVVLMLLAWHWRAPAAASLGILSVACVGLSLAGLGPQQVFFTLAFAIYAVVVWRVPWLRDVSVWFRRGAFNGSILAFTAGIAAFRPLPSSRGTPLPGLISPISFERLCRISLCGSSFLVRSCSHC